MTTLIQVGDNPDLTDERRTATFSVRSLASFLYGGPDKLDRREQIAKFVESTQDFQDPKPLPFMTRMERVENAAKKAVSMTNHADIIDASDIGEAAYYQTLVMARDPHPLSLHYVMFITTLQSQANDEQLEKWLPLALDRTIIGTYAQTELGHGTNLRKLETTAIYDQKSDEFVLNTPTVTATKWWPGNLGKSSNHAVVVAQLYTAGRWHGPHPFMVQLRHFGTHMPVSGVQLGDIGPKFGIISNDNGFLILRNVRIPRENMLMRNFQVLPTGEYVKPSHSKLGYGSMMYVRSVMISDQSLNLGMAATIAVRYSAIRRQGEIGQGSEEHKILDYQTQQFRILPQLAKAFAFYFAGKGVVTMFRQVSEQLKSGHLELLPELHALSSGLKAVVSFEVAKGIEQCRLACGGHGYSQSSGFPDLYTTTVGGCTYEGENIVMLLQVARFLAKTARKIRLGDANLAEITKYLSVTDKPDHFERFEDAIDTDSQSNWTFVNAFEHVARRKVFAVVDDLDRLIGKGICQDQAWNDCSVELCKAARAHVRVYIVKTFLNTLSQVSDEAVQMALRDLCRLFILDTIVECAYTFIEDGFMTGDQLAIIRRELYEMLAIIRPNSTALVDSFYFRDRELHSVLGRRDGHVYENLLKWAKQSELNQTDVFPAFDKYLRPMMNKTRSKL